MNEKAQKQFDETEQNAKDNLTRLGGEYELLWQAIVALFAVVKVQQKEIDKLNSK